MRGFIQNYKDGAIVRYQGNYRYVEKDTIKYSAPTIEELVKSMEAPEPPKKRRKRKAKVQPDES